MIQFLFRKSETNPASPTPSLGNEQPKKKQTSKQWTNKLASLVDEASIPPSKEAQDPENQILPRPSPSYQISLRLEGPYFTAANPAAYDTVICLVAGTGISGAIAIAAAFSTQQSATTAKSGTSSLPDGSIETEEVDPNADSERYEKQVVPSSWRRCIVVWSIRESDYLNLPFFQDTPGLEVRTHLTGKGHQRLDHGKCIGEVVDGEDGMKTWVYLSGPNAFIEAGEKACRGLGVDYFGARWA